MNSSKFRCMVFLLISLGLLVALGGLTAVVDPFFHYHGPLKGLQYPIDNQRYNNDGIAKQFAYDAILTGTSMTENFKASEFDTLFGVNSVKTPFNGSSYREIHNHLQRAVKANPNIRLILRGFDGFNLFETVDYVRTDVAFPDYLYDENLPNDVQYLFNKDILCDYTLRVLTYTRSGGITTDFDTYSSWAPYSRFGRERVLERYDRPERLEQVFPFTEEDAQRLTENILHNAVGLAQENPQITFYYYFTPYSVAYLDQLHQLGSLERQFEAFRLATELMLETENIRLFSFYNDFETITNLDHYKDLEHHTAEINSLLLERMAADEYRLTKENYEEHWQEVLTFYQNYDYDSVFGDQ